MEHEVCACDGEEGALVEGCEAVGDAAHGVLADAIVNVAAVVGSGLAAGCSEVRLDKLAILSCGVVVWYMVLGVMSELTDWKSTLFLKATLTEGVRSAVPTKMDFTVCPRALVMTPADLREAVDAVGWSSLFGIHLVQSAGISPATRRANSAATSGCSSLYLPNAACHAASRALPRLGMSLKKS